MLFTQKNQLKKATSKITKWAKKLSLSLKPAVTKELARLETTQYKNQIKTKRLAMSPRIKFLKMIIKASVNSAGL